MKKVLEAVGLEVDYGRGPVLEGVDLQIQTGELVGLLGRNGTGKTTLLRGLLGLVSGARGAVKLGGNDLETLNRREIARRVAWVPQEAERGFAFRVEEVVSMGRAPYLGRFGPMRPADRRHVDDALAATELTSLRDRLITEVSGGEWRRVLIARALAQDTEVLLLDEPTANLDLAHQLEVLTLLRGLARSERAVVASLHDLALARRWCDRVVVLAEGQIAAAGPPDRVLDAVGLARWFGVRSALADAEFSLASPPVAGAAQGEER